ncbi:MAG: hypothetical protein WCY75_04605 [Sulfurimonadaceae bacterium]|jgi:hypothetical protein|nr:hypothetical protein [Arcobacteraceae bacterium]
MDNLIFLFFLFVALELFEANWQKSDSLYGVIYNNFLVYQKSLFTFFMLNPTFFYVVFLTIYLNIDSWLMYAMMIIKFVDVAFKITMMQKLSKGEKMEDIMPVNMKMGFLYRYMNVLIYPITFLFAINAI